jgi:hypothetical protein
MSENDFGGYVLFRRRFGVAPRDSRTICVFGRNRQFTATILTKLYAAEGGTPFVFTGREGEHGDRG